MILEYEGLILFLFKWGGGEGCNNYLYLLILIYIWPEYLEKHLENMNMRADEGNGKYMRSVMIGTVQWSLNNEYWKNIVCIILEPRFC